jgi:hypothetical protein
MRLFLLSLAAMLPLPLLMASSAAAYTTTMVWFSSAHLTRGGDLTGIADGKQGTFSGWVRLRAGNATAMRLFNNGGGFIRVLRDTDNKWKVEGYNSAATKILGLTSTVTNGINQNVMNILASWDLDTGAAHLYVGGENVLAASPTLTNDVIDYARASPDWAVAARTDGTNRLTGNVADLWFDTRYIDLSDPVERAKFAVDGAPADLGANGETPTGTSPLVYLRGPTMTTNLGTGGNFTASGTPATREHIPLNWVAMTELYGTRDAPRLNVGGPEHATDANPTVAPNAWHAIDLKPYGVASDAVAAFVPYMEIVTSGSAGESVTPQMTVSIRAFGDSVADPAFYALQIITPSARLPGGIWVPLNDGKFEFYYTVNTDCCWPTHPSFQINIGRPQMWGRGSAE